MLKRQMSAYGGLFSSAAVAVSEVLSPCLVPDHEPTACQGRGS